jgi:hypothetical protein
VAFLYFATLYRFQRPEASRYQDIANVAGAAIARTSVRTTSAEPFVVSGAKAAARSVRHHLEHCYTKLGIDDGGTVARLKLAAFVIEHDRPTSTAST